MGGGEGEGRGQKNGGGRRCVAMIRRGATTDTMQGGGKICGVRIDGKILREAGKV